MFFTVAGTAPDGAGEHARIMFLYCSRVKWTSPKFAHIGTYREMLGDPVATTLRECAISGRQVLGAGHRLFRAILILPVGKQGIYLPYARLGRGAGCASEVLGFG